MRPAQLPKEDIDQPKEATGFGWNIVGGRRPNAVCVTAFYTRKHQGGIYMYYTAEFIFQSVSVDLLSASLCSAGGGDGAYCGKTESKACDVFEGPLLDGDVLIGMASKFSNCDANIMTAKFTAIDQRVA